MCHIVSTLLCVMCVDSGILYCVDQYNGDHTFMRDHVWFSHDLKGAKKSCQPVPSGKRNSSPQMDRNILGNNRHPQEFPSYIAAGSRCWIKPSQKIMSGHWPHEKVHWSTLCHWWESLVCYLVPKTWLSFELSCYHLSCLNC